VSCTPIKGHVDGFAKVRDDAYGFSDYITNTPLSCMSCERWKLLPQSLSTTVLDGNGLKAVVFAAGFGKRLAPLTASRPKHVLPLAGKPIVRHVVEALFEAGVSEVGITIGYTG
jgi:hypothetical protein